MIKMNKTILRQGQTKIIAPLFASTKDEILDDAKWLSSQGTDLVEWRADAYIDSKNPEKTVYLIGEIMKLLDDIPLIFTFRTQGEGGEQEISKEEYETLLKVIIEKSHCHAVDIELYFDSFLTKKLVKLAKENRKFTILSNHHFDDTPSSKEMKSILREMHELDADICKLAVTPKTSADVLRLLTVTNDMKEEIEEIMLITMAMGELGVISRISGHIFGSVCTFAQGKSASAPGQISIKKMRNVLQDIFSLK